MVDSIWVKVWQVWQGQGLSSGLEMGFGLVRLWSLSTNAATVGVSDTCLDTGGGGGGCRDDSHLTPPCEGLVCRNMGSPTGPGAAR